MCRIVLLAAAAVALSACAPPQQPQYVPEPLPPNVSARDQIECEAMARSGAQGYVYAHPALSTFFGAATVADVGMRDLYSRCLQARAATAAPSSWCHNPPLRIAYERRPGPCSADEVEVDPAEGQRLRAIYLAGR